MRERGRLAALLELGAGFHPELTGRENVYLNASFLGLSRKETDAAYEAIVDFAELEDFMENQVKFYSIAACSFGSGSPSPFTSIPRSC